jgi:hypothetical protein
VLGVALGLLVTACDSAPSHSQAIVQPSPTSAPTVTDHATTSTSSAVPSPDQAIDLESGSIFGFRPGPDVGPDRVREALTPVLGPPTRDTGWYVTPSVAGSEGDCSGQQSQRIVRWGSLSFAFRRSNTEILWSWALGDTNAAIGDQREPQPIVQQPVINATTAEGIGVGTPVDELERRFGSRVQPFQNGRGAFIGAASLAFEDKAVVGIGSELAVC